jgi:hypothetical protein
MGIFQFEEPFLFCPPPGIPKDGKITKLFIKVFFDFILKNKKFKVFFNFFWGF